MAMCPCLGSPRNVNEALVLLHVIEKSRFDLFDAYWRSRSNGHTDYYPGRTGTGANFLYYNPFVWPNVASKVAINLWKATIVVPAGMPDEWKHPEDEGQC